MKTTKLWISIATIFYCAISFTFAASTIDLPQYGFQIEALDANPGPASISPLMMFLPSSDGFSPNINVSIQPYPDSMKDYISLSKKQFAQMDWQIVSEKQNGSDEWVVEYKGLVKENSLHFYARAVAKNGKVYLTTGTAKESQWNSVGQIIRQHVNSFKIK